MSAYIRLLNALSPEQIADLDLVEQAIRREERENLVDAESVGALGASIHRALHDSFCGPDDDSCLRPEFWIAAAERVVKEAPWDRR